MPHYPACIAFRNEPTDRDLLERPSSQNPRLFPVVLPHRPNGGAHLNEFRFSEPIRKGDVWWLTNATDSNWRIDYKV